MSRRDRRPIPTSWPTRSTRSLTQAVSHLPDARASVAILIGTSSYEDPRLTALPAVVNNVNDLAEVLSDDELWGLPTDRIVTILDRAEPSSIVTELERNAARATDTLIVYFAGHGVLTRDGELTLSTRTTDCD